MSIRILSPADAAGTVTIIHDHSGRTPILSAVFAVVSAFMFISGAGSADTNILENSGFESGTTGWQSRACSFSTVTSPVHAGTRSGHASNRSANWQGIQQNITDKIVPGATYQVSGWMRIENAASAPVKVSMEQRDGQGTRYYNVAVGTAYDNQWRQFSGEFTLNVQGTLTALYVYFEGPGTDINFFVDDAVVYGPEPGSTEVTAQINAGVRHQLIEGFGAAGAWYEGSLVNHPQKNTLYGLLFGELGLDIYRLRNAYGQDGASAYMSRSAEIITRGEMALGRPLKILLCAWSPEAALKSNNDTVRGTLKKDASGSYMYAEYGQWWADSLAAWAACGVHADYISIQNEPDWEADWDTCRFNPTESSTVAGFNRAFDAVYEALHAQMGQNMPKMLGPETTGLYGAAGYTPGQYLTALTDHSRIYGYAHHLYNIAAGDNPDAYISAMAAFKNNWPGKPLFQTEYEKATGSWPDALNMALLLHNALTVEEVSAYLYWDLFWNSGGLISLGSSSYTINSDYYGFKHFSAFVHSGWQRIDTSANSSDLRVSAYVNPEGSKMTVVLINTNSTDALQSTLDFSGVTAIALTGQVHRTSASENCVMVGAFHPAAPLPVPARSVVTLALDVIIAPQTCQQVQDYGYRLPEDLDGDCRVSWTDLALIADQWLSNSPAAAGSTFSPDIAVNGKVDIGDLAMLAAQWLTCNAPATTDCVANWIFN